MFTKSIREKFLQYHQDDELRKWFDPLTLQCFDLAAESPAENSRSEIFASNTAAKKLEVNFPHALFAEWFQKKFRHTFEKTMQSCLPKIEISYYLPGVETDNSNSALPTINEGTDKISEDAVRAEDHNPDVLPVTDEPEEQDGYYGFNNFLFNRKNQFPVAAAQKFASGQGHHLFVLTGGSGHGKTHLLGAIYNRLKLNVHNNYIFFSQLYELRTLFTQAAKRDQSPLSWLGRFKFLILDDLDMAVNDPHMQEQLAKLLEYAGEHRIGCAVSLRQKPGDMALLDEKLRSLLESGLIIELKKPDLDIRRQYVENLCKTLNLNIKKDDALVLARMYSGFRQIHGALLKVSEFKVLSPQAAEAKLSDILQANVSDTQKSLTPDHIINKVSEYLGVSPAEVTGKNRKQDVVFARHISMFLCRELLGAQFGHIGACFSDRDHSSVMYSVNKIKELIKSDKDTNNLVSEVKNLCLK